MQTRALVYRRCELMQLRNSHWYHSPDMIDRFNKLEKDLKTGEIIRDGKNPLEQIEGLKPAAYYEFKDRGVDYAALAWLSDLMVGMS